MSYISDSLSHNYKHASSNAYIKSQGERDFDRMKRAIEKITRCDKDYTYRDIAYMSDYVHEKDIETHIILFSAYMYVILREHGCLFEHGKSFLCNRESRKSHMMELMLCMNECGLKTPENYRKVLKCLEHIRFADKMIFL